MKNMVPFLALCLGLNLNLSVWANTSPPQTVTIYTYDVLPPFAFQNDQNELTGVYIEIVKKAVSRMPDYNIAFKVVPWSRARHEVKMGNAFAILPPYFHAHDWLTDTNPKRPYIWPYSLALFTQYDVVVCNEKVLNTKRDEWPEDYKGLTFVMWRGDGRAGETLNLMAQNKEIKLFQVEDILTTIKFLQYDRADCTVTSRLPYLWLLKQKNNDESLKGSEEAVTLKETYILSRNEGYLGYTNVNDDQKFPFKKDFTIKFDIEIYKMKKSGEIERIIERFVGSNTVTKATAHGR